MKYARLLCVVLTLLGCANAPADRTELGADALITDDSVRIDVDEHGIHHVSADTDEGIAFGEGCVDAETVGPIVLAHSILTSGHAAERVEPSLLAAPSLFPSLVPHHFAWDADGYITLAHAPTLSDIDKTMILVRAPQNAELEYDTMSPEDRAALVAFTDGFNHCFARSRDRWLGQYPWLDAHGVADEVLRPTDVLARLNYFFRWGEVTASRGGYERLLEEPGTDPTAVDIPNPDYEGSSNEWWFDRRHMADDRTVIVADPHIPIALAQPYGISIRSAVGRYFGGSVVGVPGMLFGTTLHSDGNVSWSPTAAGPDGQDLFEVHPVDGGYLTSEGAVETFETERHTVGDEVFEVRTGRYGTVFGRLPSGTLLSLRSTLDRPLRTYEFIRRSNRATNLAELRAALTDDAGEQVGLHALNILAADNTDAMYLLTGRVPRRGGDPGMVYDGVSDSLDPAHEWTGGTYLVDEMPQAMNPTPGYAANNNVSPGLTDPRIGYAHPLSMIVSSTPLTTWRQESFARRAPLAVEAGPITQDQLLAFAGETHDEHWAAVMAVLLQTFLRDGDPLGLIESSDLTADQPLPFEYEVLALAMQRGEAGELRADRDDQLAAAMFDYIDRLQAAGSLHPQIEAIAGAGRPSDVTALDREAAVIAFQLWVDVIGDLGELYPEAPTLGDLMRHCWLEAGAQIECAASYGSGGSYRNTGGPVGRDAAGRPFAVLFGGHSMYQITHLGRAGEPASVEVLKAYGTDDWSDPLGPILARRYAAGEFTSVTLDPEAMNVARTQMVP